MRGRGIFFIILVLCACTENLEIQPNNLLLISRPEITVVGQTGATFNSSVANVGDAEISRHGFIWSTSIQPSQLNAEIEDLGSLSQPGFSTRIDSRLSENQRYYVRAFIEREGTVYVSDTTSFTSFGSNGPTLTSFSPARGYLGDTITIEGSNFSVQEKNLIRFDDIEAEIVFEKSDSIRVLVPNSLSSNQTTIQVSVSGQTSIFPDPFELIAPKLNGLDKTTVDFLDTVQIDAPEAPDVRNISVYAENTQGERHRLLQSSLLDNPLRMIIEPNIPYKKFKVVLVFNNQEATSTEEVNLVEPTIDFITNDKLEYGQTLTVYGAGFNPDEMRNRFWFDTLEAEVSGAGRAYINGQLTSYISAKLPLSLENAYSSRHVNFSIDVNGARIVSDQLIEINSPWFLLKNAPANVSRFSAVTEVDGRGYAMGTDNVLYRYEPETDNWTAITTFPGSNRDYPVFFGRQTKLYYGMGTVGRNSTRSMYEYDLNSGVWTTLPDFPGNERTWSTSFTNGNLSFVLAGLDQERFNNNILRDCWVFDHNTGEWSQIATHPTGGFRGSFINNSDGMFSRFQASNTTSTREIYRYDSNLDQWSLFSRFPFGSSPLLDARFGFEASKSKAYLFATSPNANVRSLYSLNTQSGEWVQEERPPMQGAYFFTVGSKMYFYGSDFPISGKFWEFDPNR